MFPQGYSIIRKDRCYGGGRAFLAVSLNISFLDLSITTDAEMVWVKISPVHGEPISICSFYILPDSNVNPINDRKIVLGMMTNINNIILAGDFNLPSTWLYNLALDKLE